MLKKLGEGIKKVWDKTIFSDMLKQKKEEKQFKREIMTEAREEAKEDIKKALKEKYKKQIVDKAVGNKEANQSKVSKVADAFKLNIGGEDKISKMLGTNNTHKDFFDTSKIDGLVKSRKKTDKKDKLLDVEDKIKRMLE